MTEPIDDEREPRDDDDRDRDRDRDHEPEAEAPSPRGFASLEAMHELAAAHALDALEPDERAAFDAEFELSPELRAEVDSYAESAGVLAALAEPVDPPPALKQRLMDQLGDLPQQSAATPGAAAPSVADVPAAPVTDAVPATSGEAVAPATAPAGPTTGRAESEARRRWFRRPGAIIGIAAAAVVLIAGAVIGIGWPGPNGWGAQREMASIAAEPDAQTQTHEVEGGGEITLVSSATAGRSGVIVEGLPELEDDQTYELWYIDDSGAAPAGTFDVSGDGTFRVLEGTFEPGVVVGVTIEPSGGSPQPTTEPIVAIPT